MPIVTQAQADALVNIINTIREDIGARPWNPNSLYTTLQTHRTDPAPYRVIAAAAVAYASVPEHRTPAMLFESGAWWPSAGATGTRTKSDPCPDHENYPAHNCGGCNADYLAGLRPAEFKGKHYDIPDTLEA